MTVLIIGLLLLAAGAFQVVTDKGKPLLAVACVNVGIILVVFGGVAACMTALVCADGPYASAVTGETRCE